MQDVGDRDEGRSADPGDDQQRWEDHLRGDVRDERPHSLGAGVLLLWGVVAQRELVEDGADLSARLGAQIGQAAFVGGSLLVAPIIRFAGVASAGSVVTALFVFLVFEAELVLILLRRRRRGLWTMRGPLRRTLLRLNGRRWLGCILKRDPAHALRRLGRGRLGAGRR